MRNQDVVVAESGRGDEIHFPKLGRTRREAQLCQQNPVLKEGRGDAIIFAYYCYWRVPHVVLMRLSSRGWL